MNALRKNKRYGSALVLVMVAMLILLILGVGYFSLGLNSRIFVIRDASMVVARSAADAGLTRAIYALNAELAEIHTNTGSWDMPAGISNQALEPLEKTNANYTYTYNPSSGAPFSSYEIISIGKSKGAVETVTALIELHTIWDYALWVKTQMTLKNGSVIDWTFPTDKDRLMGFKVGTDSKEAGSITLKQDVTVNADVVVGVGGAPTSVITGKGDVNGLTYAALQPYEWAPITPPAGLPIGGSINIPTTITSSGQYSGISLGNSQILNIGDPGAPPPALPVEVTLYVTGGITLGNGAELVINPGYKLVLYTAGNIECKNSVGMNNLSEDARALKIIGLSPTCTSIDLKAKGDFYGAIYAPNAAVIDYGGTGYNFVGAIAAKSFEQKNSGHFYYDCRLRDLTPYDIDAYYDIDRWNENSSWNFAGS